MRIVDANVLLHAVNSGSRDHEQSRAWLDAALNGRDVVGLPGVVLLAFPRLSTRRGVFPHPLGVEAATGVVRAWLDQPSCTVPEPTARHATVVTWDRDFGRFPGVRSQQPD